MLVVECVSGCSWYTTSIVEADGGSVRDSLTFDVRAFELTFLNN